MGDSARRSEAFRLQPSEARAVPDVGRWQPSPEDQILPTPSRMRRRTRRVLLSSTVFALVAAAFWNAPDERYRDHAWLTAQVTDHANALMSSLSWVKAKWSEASKSEQRTPAAQPSLQELKTAVSPTERGGVDPTSAGPADATPSQTLPAPTADTDGPAGGHLATYAPPPPPPPDALRARAKAAGLHPEMSRAVLARLSEKDFQNVEAAIRFALAETPDDGVLLWPRQRTPEMAIVQIHFVPGAPAGCRRYIVTITKDRWAATALPLERCGLPPVAARKS